MLFSAVATISLHAQKQDPIIVNDVESVDLVPSQLSPKSAKDNIDYGVFSKTKNAASTADSHDIGAPYVSGGNPESTVKEVSGKVSHSLPLATINAGSLSFSLNAAYDGQSSFKIAKEQNNFTPTSTVGVGWNLPVSKVYVDNKQTTTREDDEFYIAYGGLHTKLACVNKEADYWEFETLAYTNWKIKYYYKSYNDHWVLVKDDGVTYRFGWDNDEGTSLQKSKEVVNAWGNWIGDSKKNPTHQSTVVWNLHSIGDQWNNTIRFFYELVENPQNSNSGSKKHTEASYLKEIRSSNGGKIQLNYGVKNANEYYELHTEASEPDAYQERYEKQFLQKVSVYNRLHQLVTAFDFNYVLDGSGLNTKRYLTQLDKTNYKDDTPHSIPSQKLEYYLSGTFKGGLKKITYPSGGTVAYNYQNKYIMYNGANKFKIAPNYPSGYTFYSAVVKDNYQIYVRRSTNPISDGKYRFMIYRYWWNGKEWESHQYTFPHLIKDSGTNRLENFYSVFGDDFYGFAYDKGDKADLYLFHKEKNGNTWKTYTPTNISIGSGNPRLLQGDDFVALGTHRTGYLRIYTWNGQSWNQKNINQNPGQFYYAANNNFILSLDEDGGTDKITGANHEDNYYIHYLDAEKKWLSKSWSAAADPYISGIEEPSYFYPSNSMAGFVAEDNPELFLRWDANYNLTHVDNVLGYYDDRNPIQPSGNGMFTIRNFFYGVPHKTARFDGQNWAMGALPNSTSYYAKLNFGTHLMMFQNHDIINGVGYQLYNPNTNTYSSGSLNAAGLMSNFTGNGVTRDFVIAGNKIFKRRTDTSDDPFTQIGSFQHDNAFTYTDGLHHAFIKESENISGSINFKKGIFYYIDKETGALNNINVNQYHLTSFPKFGGNTPFMSPASIWLRTETNNNSFSSLAYRIIDDKFNQSVYDIVVDNIIINDNHNGARKVQYTFNNPKPSSDNKHVIYGETITENKGTGSGSNGKKRTIFNLGDTDTALAGYVLEEHVLDANNVIMSKTSNVWENIYKTAHNGSYAVDLKNNVLLKSKKEQLFFNGNTLETTTEYVYNEKSQMTSSKTLNSNGEQEMEEIRYAYYQYPFMRDKNILDAVYERKTRLNGTLHDVKRSVYINPSNKIHLKEKWSGPSTADIRLDSEVSYVDTKGNVLEINDRKNMFTTTLNGYQNIHNVATISNGKYSDIISQLDVTYDQLQTLNTTSLKTELMKLYDRMPNSMISLQFYDENGRVINRVDSRKSEVYIYYDAHGRINYTTDANGNMLEKREYNFAN